MDRSPEETVRALAAAAGIRPDDEELAELIRVYPRFRAALDELYAVQEARYASPALVFSAVRANVDWSDANPRVTPAGDPTSDGARA